MLDLPKLHRTHPRQFAKLQQAGVLTEAVNARTPQEALDAWLKWEGIIGYSESIWNLCEAIRECQR
jgi:hypothetical protein